MVSWEGGTLHVVGGLNKPQRRSYVNQPQTGDLLWSLGREALYELWL